MATKTITQPTSTVTVTLNPSPSEFAPTNAEVGFPSLPPPKNQFTDPYAERDYIKGRLAAAYRIFGRLGLNEGAAGHITVRDPVEPDTFWVNPFGVDFNLTNKSDLVRVNHRGEILDHGRVKLLNRPAFFIHGAIHAARPDVLCAAHTHSAYGRAFCLLGRELDMLTLESCIFWEGHAVFEGKGVVLATDDAANIATIFGPKKALLLRNHGLLTVGETIEEATMWFYTLDKCYQAQLLANAVAAGRGGVPNKITDEEAEYTRGVAGSHKAGCFGGRMLFDLIDKEMKGEYLA